jgi:Zn-dependent protease with chaperone function
MQKQRPNQAAATRMLALILALAVAQPSSLGAQTSPQLPDPGKVSMNADQQKQLGLQGMGEVYKQMPVLPDSDPMTQYVQRLGRKLSEVIPANRSWPYQFHVIPSADINAFALPGGPIFIHVATIQAADNEAELAGVMAHEISHVYMQHSAKQAPKAQVAQIFAGLAGVLLPESGLGNLGRVGIQIAGGSVLAKYSRKDESQADSVGAVIMYKAGYNPQAMADFFTKLEQKYGKGGPQFLSDHPNPGNRQAALRQQIRNWPHKDYLASSTAFERAHREAEGTKTYTSQEISAGSKSGVWMQQNQKTGAWPSGVPVSSNEGQQPAAQPAASPAPASSGPSASATISYDQIKPSGKLSQLTMNSFNISHPDNWKAAEQGDSANIAPPGGVFQNGIAYGTVIGSVPASGSLDLATQSLIQSLQRDNPGMATTAGMANIQVNGVEGRSTHLSSNSPIQKDGKPLPEHDWLITFVNRQNSLSYIVFVAPEQDFNKLKPTFEKMLESVLLR